MRSLSLLLALILIFLLLSGCQTAESAQIVATTLPAYEFTLRLCEGTGISVTPLLTGGVSCLHDYSLQVSQMRIVSGAETVICSGGGLEDSFHDVLDQAAIIIDSSEAISLLCPDSHEHAQGHDHGHDHGSDSDPHYWLDPRNASIMADTICQNLCNIYPQQQEIFVKNLASLQNELDVLYQYGITTLSQLNCRDMITFHDGFSYFAEAFDLRILAAVEEEAGSETSAQKLKTLITVVEEHQLPAIFVEANGSTASASVIAAETGIKVFTLDMAITGESYFTAMYQNIQTIKEALG